MTAARQGAQGQETPQWGEGAAPLPMPGAVLGGRFEILAHAGSGGAGEVFRARDREGSGAVAVKVLRNVGAKALARFDREAALLGQLDHPAILRYVAHGIDEGGAPYLVTEWLEGESLAQRLSRGALSIAEAVALGARVAAAL